MPDKSPETLIAVGKKIWGFVRAPKKLRQIKNALDANADLNVIDEAIGDVILLFSSFDENASLTKHIKSKFYKSQIITKDLRNPNFGEWLSRPSIRCKFKAIAHNKIVNNLSNQEAQKLTEALREDFNRQSHRELTNKLLDFDSAIETVIGFACLYIESNYSVGEKAILEKFSPIADEHNAAENNFRRILRDLTQVCLEFSDDDKIDDDRIILKAKQKDKSSILEKYNSHEFTHRILESDESATLLTGQGGIGKSYFLSEICKSAVGAGWYIARADLGKLSNVSSQYLSGRHNGYKWWELFGKQTGLTSPPLENWLLESAKVLFVFDGLNEIDRSQAEFLIERLIEDALAHDNIKVIVSSRENILEDKPKSRFIEFSMTDLDDNEIKRYLDIQSDDLKRIAHKKLLALPFFLSEIKKAVEQNKKDKNETIRFSSRFHVLKNYFDKQILKTNLVASQNGTGDNSLNLIARVAAEIYGKQKSISFTKNDWDACAESVAKGDAEKEYLKSIFLKFLGDGTLRANQNNQEKGDGPESYSFWHQLVHDYLAAHHFLLSEFSYVNLDTATWGQMNFEPILLVAETIPDDKTIEFLSSIYDYNYPNALNCIQSIREYSHGLTNWYADAIALNISLKLHDIFIATKEDSEEQIELLNINISNEILKFLREENVDKDAFREFLVEKSRKLISDDKSMLLMHWKNLFEQLLEKENTFDFSVLIMDDDPLIGWTAANVWRENILSGIVADVDWDWHGNKYDELRVSESVIEKNVALRRRIVFVMGASDEKYIADFLKRICFAEKYHAEKDSVKGDALRSLLEIAYRHSALCDGIITFLKQIVEIEYDNKLMQRLMKSGHFDKTEIIHSDSVVVGVEECFKFIYEAVSDSSEKKKWKDAIEKLNL